MTIDYALTACFGYGTADFLSGFATRRQSVAATLLIGQPVALIAIGIAAALTPGHPNWPDMALGVLAGTVGGVGRPCSIRAWHGIPWPWPVRFLASCLRRCP
jgi:hypothetical protein